VAPQSRCAACRTTAYVSIRPPHTSAYVSTTEPLRSLPHHRIRQHTSAYVSIRQHPSAAQPAAVSPPPPTSASASIRQHPPAYASIHTCGRESTSAVGTACKRCCTTRHAELASSVFIGLSTSSATVTRNWQQGKKKEINGRPNKQARPEATKNVC